MSPEDTLFRSVVGSAVLDSLLAQGAYLLPLTGEGSLQGVALVNGTEVHFARAPDWQGSATRRWRAIRAFLRDHLAREPLGFLTTRILNERVTERRFVQSLGFRPTWSDGVQTFYLIGAPK